MKNVADIYSLSPMQELMLVHALTSDQDDDVLFNQIVYRLCGRLDVAAYERAWQHVVERHPALRTMFVWQKSKDPVQVVREKVSLAWASHDWREYSATEQDEQLETLLAADRAAGFDLLRPPLMRLILTQVAADERLLVWSSHHLVNDRWCIGLILDEVALAYDAFIAGNTPTLPPAPRYRDYIGWLAAQDEAAARTFWQGHLHDWRPRPLPLTATTDTGLATVRETIGAAETAVLRRFALDHDLTLGALVPAAWSVVLGAAANSDDVLFGVTVSGRPPALPGVTSMVGSFINNVPLRLTLPGAEPLSTWLPAVQAQQLALQDYEHNSPAQIREWANLQTRDALFNTLVVVQGAVDHATPAGITMQFERGRLQTGYPVTLEAAPVADCLTLTLTYDRAQVTAALAAELVQALQQVLLAMPQQTAVSPADLRQMVTINAIPANGQVTDGKAVTAARPEYAPPTDLLENKLVNIWEEVLQVRPIGIHDNYFELGVDSLQTVAIFNRIEKTFKRGVPLGAIFQAPTISELAAIMRESGEQPAWSSLVPISVQGSKRPFFCVHGGAGHVYHYRTLAQHLESERPFYGLQPANEDGAFGGDVATMAADYLREIRRVQPEGPYHVGGFCFGGIVAFEMAKQLRAAGEAVALVALIDTFSPGYEEQSHIPAAYAHLSWWQRHARGIGAKETAAEKAAYVWRSLRGRVETMVIDPLKRHWRLRRRHQRSLQLRWYRATNQPLPSHLQDHEAMSASAMAYKRYLPEPYAGDLTVFRRTEVTAATPDDLGWRRLTTAAVHVHKIPGYHMDLLKEPSVGILAQALQASLERHEQPDTDTAVAADVSERLQIKS